MCRAFGRFLFEVGVEHVGPCCRLDESFVFDVFCHCDFHVATSVAVRVHPA